MASTLVAMASILVAMASNLIAMASTLVAMASTLVAMASNLVAMTSTQWRWLWLLPQSSSQLTSSRLAVVAEYRSCAQVQQNVELVLALFYVPCRHRRVFCFRTCQ